MENLISIILASGKTGVDIALYILLPVMVVMMAFMKIMEVKGILRAVALFLTPVLRYTGISGLGVFAALQIMLVSFAAPLATLNIMETAESKRRIGATLAMVFAMSQANVIFPMAAVGLNLPVIFLTSAVGGLVAAMLTYYVFSPKEETEPETDSLPKRDRTGKNMFQIVTEGGQEAINAVLKSIPLLIIAICFMNILKEMGGVALLEKIFTPFLEIVGISGVSVLPIATKFLAGGTAMMGVAMDLLKEGTMSTQELNRIAGFIINPFDLVGVAVLISAGKKSTSVLKPAIYGAAVGILIRGTIHLIIF